MKLTYVKVRLIKEFNGDPPGTVFRVDKDTAKYWKEIGRAEDAPKNAKATK